jgi:amino acid adenylation domain-containing protein
MQGIALIVTTASPTPITVEQPGYFRKTGSEFCFSIHATFSAVAHEFYNSAALECDAKSLTYAELDARANTIAYGLIRRGVKPGSVVGLYMPRSIETIAAILGVLKAGAAYVPFDPAYPAPLLKFIYSDSAPTLMLAQPELLAQAGIAPFWDGTALDINRDFAAFAASEATPALPQVGPDDRAYIMYTSGSTGRPKGVQIPHRAVLRLVIDNDFAEFGPNEVLLQLAPLAFDASTFEIWAALLHGGRLAILSTTHPSLDEIAQTIAKHRVTTCWLTAGLFHLMVDHQLAGLQPLKQLLAGGDVLSVEHVDKALRGLPNCRLINGYGPTENTTFSCCYTIPHARIGDHNPIPIGTAIRHCEVRVLDPTLRPVADGDDGELFVGGPGLGLGYLNRPELNAERFIPHPFTVGAHLYRTGDRVRRRADGNLEFLGRVDRQVKINGKRVELDEIEACLRRSGAVGDAAVISYEIAGQRRVAAYLTPLHGAAPDLNQVRSFLRAELPDYMLPAVITTLATLPLSPTGKVERNKLPIPTADVAPASAAATPKNALEAALLTIWQRALGGTAVGIDDNFFDLGGTSLQMMTVHAAIQRELQHKLTIVDLFTYPRISALAAWLTQGESPAPAGTQSTALSAQDRARKQQAALAARARPAPRMPGR